MSAASARSVVIADLGLGNLHSVARAVERAGGKPIITGDPDALRSAEKVIVPGQGAFRDCAIALERGFGEALRELIAAGTPYLGICLGMQLLFEESEESPGSRGLGHFAGKVARLGAGLRDPRGEHLKVPQIGWNEVVSRHAALPPHGWFYFLHSYVCVPSDPSLTVGVVSYGAELCAAVARDNVFGCQFHPEKSQEEGHALLTHFVEGQGWS